MFLNTYWSYGLNIHTDLVCSELPRHPHPINDPDVTIILLPHESGTLRPLPDCCYEVQPRCFRLDVSGVARYRVEGGKRIMGWHWIAQVGDARIPDGIAEINVSQRFRDAFMGDVHRLGRNALVTHSICHGSGSSQLLAGQGTRPDFAVDFGVRAWLSLNAKHTSNVQDNLTPAAIVFA